MIVPKEINGINGINGNGIINNLNLINMTTKTKTIKGWANNSTLLFSPNTTNNLFISNLKDYVSKNLKGYKKLNFYDTLRGKNATKKVIIKGYYWRGSWSDPTKETVAIFYK